MLTEEIPGLKQGEHGLRIRHVHLKTHTSPCRPIKIQKSNKT